MIKVSNEELSKISQFISSCDDMVNGKFILADVKITKILNMIAGSEELYRYISECLVSYDFLREYHRAEVKNGLNGGVFAVPTEPNKLVAFVFCLLVECDAKRIDFYSFINENFKGENKSEAYQNFAAKLLVPFKEIIASHFALSGVSEQEVSNLTKHYREDLQEEPIFNDNFGQTNYDNPNFQNQSGYIQNEYQSQNINPNQNEFFGNGYGSLQSFQNTQFAQNSNFEQESYLNENQNVDTSNINQHNFNESNIQNQDAFDAPTSKFQAKMENLKKSKDVWTEIVDICSNIESSVYAERHLKQYLKDELLYILKAIKYSTKYKDVKIVSALVTAFDELSKKYRSIQFTFGELKNKIERLYE